MVKKNLVNKNVVRALSIGLSLAMASQPMMAMAAGENGNNDEPTGEVVAQPTASEVAAAEAKSDTTNAAMKSAVDETKKAVDEVNTADRIFGREIETGVDRAADALYGEFDNNGGTPFINDVKEETARLQKDAQDIANKENDLDGKADKLDEMAEEANGYAQTADGAVEDADELLTELEGKLDDAEAKFEEGKSELGKAGNQGAADAAYGKAAQAVADATQAVEDAQTAYDLIKKDYDDAKAAYDDVVEEYNDLWGQYQEALTEYNNYKAAATGESSKLFNELGALKTKAENLEKAAKEAKEKADRAKTELENKKSAVDSTLETLKTNEYAKLKTLEDALKAKIADNYYGFDNRVHDPKRNDPEFVNADGSYDGTYTEYIEAVIKLYYVKDVLKGTEATVTWVRDAENPELDYAEVSYTDKNGQPAIARLNGKLINGNNEHEFGGLVIYEKYEKTTVTEDVYKAGDIDITDEIDKVGSGVYVDTEDNLLIAKKSNGDYVYADGEGRTSKKVLGPNQYIDEESKKTSYVYEGGQIKKVVTADVYETKFENENVSLKGSEATYESEADAKAAYIAAVQAEIDKLVEGETLKVGSGPAAKVYKAGDKATDAGFKKTGGEQKDEWVQDGFEMKATYYKQYTEDVAKVYPKSVTETILGTYTEYFSSAREAEEAGNRYWNSLSKKEKQELIANIIKEVGTQGYVEDVYFVDYEGASARAIYNTNTATACALNEVQIRAVQRDNGWAYEIIGGKDGTFVECEVLERRGHEVNTGSWWNPKKQWVWDETPDEFASRARQAGYVLEIKDDKAYYAPQKSTGSASQVVVIEDKAEMDRLNGLLVGGVTKEEAEEFAGAFNANALNADAVAEQAQGDHRKVEAFGAVVDASSVKAHKVLQKVTSPFGFKGVTLVKKAKTEKLVKSGKEVETTVWTPKAVQKTAGETIVEYTDKNYYDGDVLFGTEFVYSYYTPDYKTDKNTYGYFDFFEEAQSMDYRYKLDHNASEIQSLTRDSESYGRQIEHQNKLFEQYKKIETQANKAKEEVKKAQNRVDYIWGLLAELDYDRDLVAIQELESDLKEANSRLEKAIERRDILVEALKELQMPTFGGGGEGGGEPGGDEGTLGAPAVLPAPTLLAGPAVAAPAAFVAAPAAAAGEGTIDIAEPQTALAAEVPEEKKEEPQLTTLPQQQTPLAAAPINEETLSWWWLLIIAVLGGAGYAMYKKFQTKKDEKTTN